MTLLKSRNKVFYKYYFFLIVFSSTIFQVNAQYERNVTLYYITEEEGKGWDKIHKKNLFFGEALYTDSTICFTVKKENGSAKFTKYYRGGKLHITGENLYVHKNENIINPTGTWKYYSRDGNLVKEIAYQDVRMIYRREYDENGNIIKNIEGVKFSYGFAIGLSAKNLIMNNIPNAFEFKPIYPSFDLGFYYGYRFSRKLVLRMLPMFDFDVYRVTFEENSEIFKDKLSFTNLKVPVNLRYNLTKNLLFLGGIYGSYSVLGPDEEKQQHDIRKDLKRINYGIDLGIGYEKELKYFTVLYEIRYSHQLNNWVKNSEVLPSSIRQQGIHFSLILKDKW